MSDARDHFFDQHTAPLEERIATGLGKLGLAMKHASWRLAHSAGLSPTQGQILVALLSGEATGTEIAKRLGVTLPTVSDAVSALVAKGLLRKEPDPRHARAKALVLTAKGRRVADGARGWPDFLAHAIAVLEPAEKAVFWSALVKMISTLQERGEIPTSRMCASCTFFRPHVRAGSRPHHCALVDAPMAESHLRIECAEHEEASVEARSAAWRALTREV